MKSARRNGFTFVEVLAALAFLGILIPVIVSALTLANRASVVAERTSKALQLAENRLNELIALNTWSAGETRGDFGELHPGYRWEMIQRGWEAGPMTELTLEVSFEVQGKQHEVQLSTLVSETSVAP